MVMSCAVSADVVTWSGRRLRGGALDPAADPADPAVAGSENGPAEHLCTYNDTDVPTAPADPALLNPLVIQEGAECPRWISNPNACTEPERCGLYQKCKRCSALVYAENLTGWLLLQPNGDLQLYTVRPEYMPPVPSLGWGRIVLTWSTHTNLTKASEFALILLKDGTWELWGGSKTVPYGVRATSAGSFFGLMEDDGSPNSYTYPENAGEANAPFKLRVFDYGVHRIGWSYAVIENKDRRPAWSTLDVNPCTNQAVCPGDPLALCRPTADWTGQMRTDLALGRPTSLYYMTPDQSTQPGDAVDGNLNTAFLGNGFWPGLPPATPYWQVYLDSLTNIAHIEVIGSFSYGFSYVNVGGTFYNPTTDHSNPAGIYERRVLDFDPPVAANWIQVHSQIQMSYYQTPLKLTLAEVIVYGNASDK
ncbi:hypothetical protein HYH03_007102 [Edaphochlamys debaryana]|uniref:Uncharacterized protein n=1 Tax=Edaphochlamys debaryana TaxID=47281 RepID=A0A836C0F4_9CHLO|nr:hypothetical protein HYH03_007102 [Edaphochlamys debaryana]|eukprot:KAG2494862.1 hypothetical protein HYH03_007102 [Edaphochlamys debaryana]